MQEFDKIQHSKKAAFLAAFAETGSIRRSAKLAGIDRTTHYNWMAAEGEDGFEYREAFAAAKRRSIDALVDSARRRAQQGVRRAVRHKGQIVGYERHYSDVLTIFLLKGLDPETFGDKAGKGDAPEEPQPLNEVVNEIKQVIRDEQGTHDDHERGSSGPAGS